MSHNEFEQILMQYPSRCRGQLVPVAASSLGFSGARIWRIETDAEVFCLRMPSQTVDTVRLAGLHRLLAHTSQAGIRQISVPLTTVSRASFVEAGDWVWQVEPWMPGVADFREHPRHERLAAAMECLARWHQSATTFSPRQSELRWFEVHSEGIPPAINNRLERLGRWDAGMCRTVRGALSSLGWPEFSAVGSALLDVLARQIGACMHDLRMARLCSVPLLPCLRDVWHDHLLLTGDEVTGLIDAHSCRTDSVAVDLARLLGSLLPHETERWDAALEAYQRNRPLSTGERLLVVLFDHSGTLLSGLSWLEWCCLERREFADRGRVVARLTEIVRRLEGFEAGRGAELVWTWGDWSGGWRERF